MTLRNEKYPEGKTFESLGGYGGSFQRQMQEFVDILSKGVPVKNTVEMCMGEVMVAKAIYKSVETKKWEKTSLENLIGY